MSKEHVQVNEEIRGKIVPPSFPLTYSGAHSHVGMLKLPHSLSQTSKDPEFGLIVTIGICLYENMGLCNLWKLDMHASPLCYEAS